MGHYLIATIESVLCNLRPGDEYFIIDGGSSDESVNIIRAYESRITGWISEPDKGYADAIAKVAPEFVEGRHLVQSPVASEQLPVSTHLMARPWAWERPSWSAAA